jgi:hypothetical protein
VIRNLPDLSCIFPQLGCVFDLQISKRGRILGGEIPELFELGNNPELIGGLAKKKKCLKKLPQLEFVAP